MPSPKYITCWANKLIEFTNCVFNADIQGEARKLQMQPKVGTIMANKMT